MDTAIVILNWNGLHFMKRFLPVLEACTPKENFFLVVADNGSTDGSVEWLKAEHPNVQLIEFDRNYGFTEGYNRAFREIEADYYILLNSDVEVTPGWAETLINFMEDSQGHFRICRSLRRLHRPLRLSFLPRPYPEQH